MYQNMIYTVINMLGLFRKRCPTCGIEVREKKFKRFGKRFCSEEHQAQFIKEAEKQRKKSPKSSCCCG